MTLVRHAQGGLPGRGCWAPSQRQQAPTGRGMRSPSSVYGACPPRRLWGLCSLTSVRLLKPLALPVFRFEFLAQMNRNSVRWFTVSSRDCYHDVSVRVTFFKVLCEYLSSLFIFFLRRWVHWVYSADLGPHQGHSAWSNQSLRFRSWGEFGGPGTGPLISVPILPCCPLLRSPIHFGTDG